jgi:hypothetical protein
MTAARDIGASLADFETMCCSGPLCVLENECEPGGRLECGCGGRQVVDKNTLEKILVVMKNHLTRSQVRAIVADLNEVPGTKSFRDTVEVVAAVLESDERLDPA